MEAANKGVWAVAGISNERSVIGKIKGIETLTDVVRLDIIGQTNRVICFERGIDFFTPLQQMAPERAGESPRIGRIPLTLGFEFTLHPTPFYAAWYLLYFFDDIQPEDRKIYQRFIDQLDEQMELSRAKQAGIVVPKKANVRPLHLPDR